MKIVSLFMLTRLIYLLLALITSSCANTTLHRAATEAYKCGDFETTDELLSKRIHREMPQKDYWHSKNSSCLLLDRATTRFVEGKVSEAILDYDLAIQSLDYYGQDSSFDTAQQVLIEDDSGAYQASDVEQILARVYFALALWHQGDYSNAEAILRQAEQCQQSLQAEFSHSTCHIPVSANPLAKYLFAIILENRGDFTNAQILYRQAEELLGCLPPRHNLGTELATSSTILLVCHNGNIPFKVSATSDASIASAIALEVFLSVHNIEPAFSSLPGIPAPMYCQNISSQPEPIFITVDGVTKPLFPLYDVAAASYQELEHEKPLIVARGVARFLIRRGAVAYVQQRDPCAGALADFGMFLINANTKADTRAWSTLPSSIDVAQFKVEPGDHRLIISIDNPSKLAQRYPLDITISEGDLCIINIFNVHPQVTSILIPQKYSKG